MLKELSHLPVIVDPSHAAGRRDLVEPLSLAAAAAGADGIIVEVHPQPEEAICDGPQQLRGSEFADYAAKVEQAAAHRRQVARRRGREASRSSESGSSAARSPSPRATASARTCASPTRAARRWPSREALDGADVAFVAAPLGVLGDVVDEVLAAAPADCVVSDVGSVKALAAARRRALLRRPPARRLRAARARARARRPLRRRDVVPDADAAARAASCSSACTA